MREIKFRVWDTEFKRMLFYGPSFSLAGGCLDLHTTLLNQTCNPIGHNLSFDTMEDSYKYSMNRFKLQQFTGFKDKNGTDVYEGDIFKGGNYKWGPVKFDNAKFTTNLMGARVYDLCELFEENEKPEIIGNIFQNPKLLDEDSTID
jgi:hypothetical protein